MSETKLEVGQLENFRSCANFSVVQKNSRMREFSPFTNLRPLCEFSRCYFFFLRDKFFIFFKLIKINKIKLK